MVPSFEAWEPSGWRRVAGMTSLLERRGERGGERRKLEAISIESTSCYFCDSMQQPVSRFPHLTAGGKVIS